MNEIGCCKDSLRESAKDYRIERKIMGPDSTLPPLPEPVSLPTFFVPGGSSEQMMGHEQGGPLVEISSSCRGKFLQEGCYYLRLIPTSLHTPPRHQYEGTMRIQRIEDTVIGSGDLYKKNICESPTFCPSLAEEAGQDTVIPVFPRHDYAYYIRVTGAQARKNPGFGEDILLELESFRFEPSHHAWGSGETMSTQLHYAPAPDGIHYWRGDLQTESKVVIGHLIVVHISSHLRQARVEIDCAPGLNYPIENKKGEGWTDIFRKAGWDVSAEICAQEIDEPEDRSWSTAELHDKMLTAREKINLDKQWHYHLLVVSEIDDGAFGVMYDNTIYGVQDIPREGAAVAGLVEFNNDERWGHCRNQKFHKSQDPFFRTAVHEIGHAMLLYHPDNSHENYIMQETVHIAGNAGYSRQFPYNIQWTFSPRDIRLLGHLPDIAVRPGGVSFGTPYHRLPVNVQGEVIEAEGLELIVEPLIEVVPIGAPVRVNFSLVNRADRSKTVPGSLRMKSGHISGRVIDPLGAGQEFATILQYTGETQTRDLLPGDSMSHALTLLWGTQGPLFPTSGFYRVVLELNWYQDGVRVRLTGSTSIMITPPEGTAHAETALKILSKPDTLLALAIGGDHIEAGNEAIDQALDNKVLKPHFDLIAAKRWGQRHLGRSPKLDKALSMMDDRTVMTGREVVRMAKVLRLFKKSGEQEPEVVEKFSQLIRSKAKSLGVEEEAGQILEEKYG